MPSELVLKTVGGGALENPVKSRCRRCKMPQGVESLRQKDKALMCAVFPFYINNFSLKPLRDQRFFVFYLNFFIFLRRLLWSLSTRCRKRFFLR